MARHIEEIPTSLNEQTMGNESKMTHLHKSLSEHPDLKRQLQDSEDRFRTILEAGHHKVCVQNGHGFVVYANEEFLLFLGISRQEITGHPIADFVQLSQRGALSSVISQRKRTDRNTIPIAWILKCGRIVETLVLPISLWGPDGNFAGAYLIITEIQDTGEREDAFFQEKNLLRTLMDSLPDFVYVKDVQSRFITTNTAHLQVLGTTDLSQVIGKTDFDFFPLELAQEYYVSEQKVMTSGKPLLNRAEEVMDSDGNRRWVLTFKAPLRDSSGGVVGIVG
ncbi:MAG: PAS domain S-box protein, partial [Ignavibacteria bacterium]|nr:PAS domain S-box protein [Ignavibacteria bacterium]